MTELSCEQSTPRRRQAKKCCGLPTGTTGAEGLDSSQSRRITKPRRDPKQPRMGEQRANGSIRG